MRVLLSTIGSRGDVQPLVALATQLTMLGQEVHLCVPPDFAEWIEGLGMTVTPIGPELRPLTATRASAMTSSPTPEQRRQMVDATVAAQFETVAAAAKGCDAIIAATALQIGARSVAEVMRVPYVFVAYCPAVLPSSHHAPPPLPPVPGQSPAPATTDNRELWARSAARFTETFGGPLNAHRASLGLTPVSDVASHIFGDRPWLATDPTLGPWPDAEDAGGRANAHANVYQAGAWLLADERPLSPALETFLSAGEPPVYFGFGSIRATPALARAMVESARAHGRRAIISAGWADLSPIDDAPDCIAIGEANLRTLFGRVAAVVHHGGAGTTTLAALGGAPQVVIPQVYDQHYWARRVAELGIGAAHASGTATTISLTAALAVALEPEVAVRAKSIATLVRTDGARTAAERVVAELTA